MLGRGDIRTEYAGSRSGEPRDRFPPPDRMDTPMSKKSRLQNRARPTTPKVSVALATEDGPNRKVRKEEARREREALERKIARRGYLRWAVAGLVVVAVAAVAVVVVLNKGPATPPDQAGASPLPGASTGNQPWPPEYAHLSERIAALGLPAQDGTAFHVHQHLDVSVDGTAVQVPQLIGAETQTQAFAPIHTHDSTGVIHLESPIVRTFTLGDVFGVWGVYFTPDCLGAYCNQGDKTLRVFVNGKAYAGDFTKLVLKPHQEILVAYGTAAELPKKIPSSYQFPSGE